MAPQPPGLRSRSVHQCGQRRERPHPPGTPGGRRGGARRNGVPLPCQCREPGLALSGQTFQQVVRDHDVLISPRATASAAVPSLWRHARGYIGAEHGLVGFRGGLRGRHGCVGGHRERTVLEIRPSGRRPSYDIWTRVREEQPMTMTDTPRLDEAALEQFVHQAVGDLAAAISGLMVHLGDRLGLYRAMAGAGPVTPSALADGHRHRGALRAGVAGQPGGRRLRGLPPCRRHLRAERLSTRSCSPTRPARSS